MTVKLRRPAWLGRHRIASAMGLAFVVAIVFALVLRVHVARHGHAAFPTWLWDLYDWKTWPLHRLR